MQHSIAQSTWQLSEDEKIRERAPHEIRPFIVRCNQRPGTMILAVMLDDGPYASSVESRIRSRQAILSGMRARNYVPENDDHIGYFVDAKWQLDLATRAAEGARKVSWSSLPWPLSVAAAPNSWSQLILPPPVAGWLQPPPSTQPESEARSAGDDQPMRLGPIELSVPYEWWRFQSRGYAVAASQNPRDSILVMWLPESSFSDRPLDRLSELFDGFSNVNDIAVIGPTGSTTLRQMTINAVEGERPSLEVLKRVRFLSPWSTAEDSTLDFWNQPGWSGKSIKEFMECKGGVKTFDRITATDSQLSKALIAELKLRGVDAATDQIALVSEWDTLYGRSLPLTFATIASGKGYDAFVPTTQPVLVPPANISREKVAGAANIRMRSYLRGIDGKLPDDPKPDGKSADPSQAVSTARRAPIEQTEGQDQSDYLRRMANQLAESDRVAQHELKAIGVLGSDVYDKLMVLKALRPRFPHALFFTTDLDARFYHPEELNETHNLIIASPFGLRLSPVWQQEVAPFRDSYQTASYLATCLALGWGDDEIPDMRSTRMFEIGRSRPIDLLRANSPLHPPPSYEDFWAFYVPYEALGTSLLFVIAAGLSVIYLGWDRRRLRAIFSEPLPVMIFSCGIAALIVFIIAYCQLDGGVPLLFTERVSIWPTEAVWLACLFYLIFLFRRANSTLRKNADEVNVMLSRVSAVGKPPAPPTPLQTRPWQSSRHWEKSLDADGTIDGFSVWREYLQLSGKDYRPIRIAILCIIYLLVVIPIFYTLGFPHTPYRGKVSLVAGTLIFGGAFAGLVLLTFYIGDAAQLCRRMVINLWKGPSNWTICEEMANTYGTSAAAAEVVDVTLVGMRSRVVGRLIYYPLAIATIIFLARNTIFANWDWPLSLIVLCVLHLGYATYCHIGLRHEAENLRTRALQSLEKQLQAADGTTAEGITRAREFVANIKEGAFGRLSDLPAIRGLLLPSSGLGIWAVVEYFAK